MGDKVRGAPSFANARDAIRDDRPEAGRRRSATSQLGSVHRGLTLEDGSLVSVTGNYLKVRIPPGRTRNEWVDVRITGVNGTGVFGEIGELSNWVIE